MSIVGTTFALNWQFSTNVFTPSIANAPPHMPGLLPGAMEPVRVVSGSPLLANRQADTVAS